MADISSGVAATSSQYNNHEDRIAALEANTVTTGGSSTNIGYDERTDTLSSTGSVTVPHNLGWTPTSIDIQMRGNPSNSGPYITYVSTKTDSSFIVFFGQINSSGHWNPGASGQSVTYCWTAFK